MNKQEKRWVKFWTKFLKRNEALTSQGVQIKHMIDVGKPYCLGLENGFEQGFNYAKRKR